MFEQMVMPMCAISHTQAIHTGIASHQEVVRRVADHDSRCHNYAKFRHYFIKHLWVWFGVALISTARRLKKGTQAGMIKRAIKAVATFTRRNSQDMPGSLKARQHFPHPGKQQELVVTGQIVKAIALRNDRVALRRQTGNRMTHRVNQAKADHMTRPSVIRHR